MISLQSYRGKGRSASKVFYRIQPYINGKRVTIRLGSGKKQAQKAAAAIADLIDCQGGEIKLSSETKKWLATVASESLCSSLKKYGLIDELPDRFLANNNAVTIGELADDFVRTRCAGLDEATKVLNRKAKANLIDCFGDVDIRSLSKRDGREFWRWLLNDNGLGENTAKQRLRYARSFFDLALEDGLVTVNPFKARGLSVSQTAAEKDYVEKEVVEKVIEKCPTAEWKLLFALCRAIPMRIPSEIREFTWSDVDWQKNQMLIHSPKTRRIGKSARLVPIFESVRPYLETLRGEVSNEEQYVFPELRKNTNPGTNAKRIVEDAGFVPWCNFFNSLRASAETDLMDEYGLRKACMWAGNSAATAMKNYALVKKTDFDDSAPNVSRNGDAKSDAILDGDAKSDAEPASNARKRKKPNKKGTARN